MKKFFRNIAFAAAAVVSGFGFASCDEDQITSNILTGDWSGDFGMFYDYSYGHRVYRFDSYDTDISFFPEYDYAKYGYGYQVDFYDYGPYTEIYHYFRWEVRNQNIYINYRDEVDLNTIIYRYRMSDSKFTGYFDDSQSKFCLHKTAEYYNWDYYCNDYGDHYHYYDRDDWRYDFRAAVTRSANGAEVAGVEDLGETDAPEGIVGFGNRFGGFAK